MGINVGTAWVTIAASAKGISKGIEKDLKGAGTKAGTGFGKEFNAGATKQVSSASSGLKSFGTSAIVGAAAVGAAFFGLASAAGNLDAAVAANVQVLGDASQAVQDFAETGVESVGLSETAILNAATTFGQLGKVIGLTGDDLSTFSTDLVVLAADMAAFKNVTPTQALEDLQSAFAGQPEVLRKYGVFLDDATLKSAYFRETGEKVSGTLTAQQRLIATNAELWRQTGDIQGQAARESGSFERAIANLKATVSNVAADFGAPLVGFAGDLIGAVSDGIGFLSDFNEETGGMFGAGLLGALGVAAAASAVAGFAVKLKGLHTKFGDLSPRMQTFTKGAGLAALVVGEAIVIYQAFTQASRDAAARTAEVAAALPGATEEAWQYAESLAGATGEIDGFAVAQRALNNALLEGDGGEELTLALGELNIVADDALTTLTRFDDLEGPTGLRDLYFDLAIGAGHTRAEAELLANTLSSGQAFTDSGLAAMGFSDALIEDARAMQEVRVQAGQIGTEGLAEDFLNRAASTDVATQALIADAEAMATADGQTATSVDIYNSLLTILGEMPPAEREAAASALGLGSAQEEAAAGGAALNEVAASTIDLTTDVEDAMSDAASTADAFTSAIDRLVGSQLTFQEAGDQLQAGIEELNEQIRLAQEEEEGYALTLDGSTEAGRDNREMIRGRVEDVLSMADAEIEAGHGIDAAAVSLQEQRTALIAQIRPFFDTERAAAAYIDQLGLTPEAITTAVVLSQQEQAKAAVEDWIANHLGTIPETEATAIQALIDEGAYDRALLRIRAFETMHFTASVYVGITGPGARVAVGGGRYAQAGAYGGYVPGNSFQPWLLGERSWDEAILTVGNMENLRRQLMNDRISAPIIAALPTVGPMGGGSSGRSRRGGGDVIIQSYEQNPTPAGGAAMIRMAGVQ